MHKVNIDKNVLIGHYKLLEQKVNNILYTQAVDEVIEQATVAMARYIEVGRSADKT